MAEAFASVLPLGSLSTMLRLGAAFLLFHGASAASAITSICCKGQYKQFITPVCNSNFPRGACKYSCYGDSVSGYPAYTWCQKGFMSAHYCPSLSGPKSCCHSCQRLRSGFEAVNSTEVRSGFSVEQELRTSENVSQIEAKDKTATENKENGELPGNATSLPSLRGMRMP